MTDKIKKEDLLKGKGKFIGVNHKCGPHKHKTDRRNSVKKEKSKKEIDGQLE